MTSGIWGEIRRPSDVARSCATYARATVAAGSPVEGSCPIALSVSLTQGGLTTLMRMERGRSSAAI